MAAWVGYTFVTAFMVIFAGCVGGDSAPAATSTGPAAQPTFDESTGSIQGMVTDDEGQPLQGAMVGLVDMQPEVSTVSDPDGAFTFNNIEPGTYKLAVNAIGHDSQARNVEVRAGEVTEVKFVMKPIAVEKPYPQTQMQDGLLVCSFRAYPGVPLGVIVADGWYSGVAVCGISPINSTTGDKFMLNWKSPKGVREVTLEMSWTTNQALGKGLGVALEDPEGVNNGNPTYGNDNGVSPLRVDANETKVLNVTDGNGRDCIKRTCEFTTRVFAEANTTEFYAPVDPPAVEPFGAPPKKIDAGVVLNQRFTQYLTTFHYMSKPDGFTALADQ